MAYPHTALSAVVLWHALPVAKAVMTHAAQVTLAACDRRRVLAVLEHPPSPYAKRVAAAQALPAFSCRFLSGMQSGLPDGIIGTCRRLADAYRLWHRSGQTRPGFGL